MQVTTRVIFQSFSLLILASGLILGPLSYGEDSTSSLKLERPTETVIKIEEVDSGGASSMAAPAVVSTPKRFKASFDRFFYEFDGTRGASQRTNGITNYEFNRVTYDTQTLALTYLYDPTLSFTVSNTYQEIYAETWFGKGINAWFTDKTVGFGDTLVKGSKTFLRSSGIYVVELGALMPTGSITEKNESNTSIVYPYNMQLGSGTQDFQVSATYLKLIGKHQLGAFGMATVRTGRNGRGYRRGDEYLTRAWYGYAANSYLTPGIWANFLNIQGIHGRDPDFRNDFSDELLRFYYNTRTFWDITPNVRAEVPLQGGIFKLKATLGAPLAQHSRNVDDIQLYTQWFMSTGIEGTF